MFILFNQGNYLHPLLQSAPTVGAYANQRGVRMIRKLLLAIFAMAVFQVSVWKCSGNPVAVAPQPEKTAEQLENEARKEAEFQTSVIMVKALRLSMKDPSSFELVNAGRLDNGTICLIYRAKNSFNALVVERVSITKKGDVRGWDQHCAGKNYNDISHIRHAL